MINWELGEDSILSTDRFVHKVPRCDVLPVLKHDTSYSILVLTKRW